MKRNCTLRSRPVPVRLDLADHGFLRDASGETGLTVSDLLRRSVKLMRRHRLAGGSYAFLVTLK